MNMNEYVVSRKQCSVMGWKNCTYVQKEIFFVDVTIAFCIHFNYFSLFLCMRGPN